MELLYFSSPACSVCSVVYDKTEKLLSEHFSKMKLIHVDCSKQPELAAKYAVFSAPVIVILIEGKEYLRLAGYVSVLELKEKIARYYSLYY